MRKVCLILGGGFTIRSHHQDRVRPGAPCHAFAPAASEREGRRRQARRPARRTRARAAVSPALLPHAREVPAPAGFRHWQNRQRRHRWHHPLKRSEEHTSELQSLMRTSYAVFCLKKKKQNYKLYIFSPQITPTLQY